MLHSPIQHLWIPGKAPGLNELLAARGRRRAIAPGRIWTSYTEIKRSMEQRVVYMARAQQLQPVESGYFTYVFFEEDRRRDPSNVAAAGIKCIEDGLQLAKIIPRDGWKTVLGFAVYWVVDKDNPGTVVYLSKHAPLSKQDALMKDEEIRRCPPKTPRS